MQARVGMQYVVLDPTARTVRYLRPGLEINLGSIGKGYALDRAAAGLRDGWGVGSALLHGGKSSVYAVGGEPDFQLQILALAAQAQGERVAGLLLRERVGEAAGTGQGRAVEAQDDVAGSLEETSIIDVPEEPLMPFRDAATGAAAAGVVSPERDRWQPVGAEGQWLPPGTNS